MTLKHSLIKEGSIEPRIYQETILNTAVNKNTLVVLPTGLGKTFIAALLAAKRLELNLIDGKILFLAPTKPLVQQHYDVFKEIFKFPKEEFNIFTGLVSPMKRNIEYENTRFIFATPQTISNDLVSNKLNLKDVVLLIVDEAHRTSGEYPYGFIAKKYVSNAKEPRILALTASPGSYESEIERVCKELFIDEVEFRDRKDSDVKPYIKHREFNWEFCELPKEFLRIRSLLETVFSENLMFLKRANIIRTAEKNAFRKKQILLLQADLVRKAQEDKGLYPYLSSIAALLKIYHAIELLETQGIRPLHSYFKKFYSDKSKAAFNLLTRPEFKQAIAITEELKEKRIEHPKMQKLMNILKKEKKAIVFAHYRVSVDSILKELKKKKIRAISLIGQAKSSGTGISQKEQIKRLDEFRKGKHGVLVATSIGEEGLDIPEVDHVIFYEPVPSAIRSIQRAGRTARHKPGKITILIAKDTRDQAYYWSSHHKEKRMGKVLEKVNIRKAQKTLDIFSEKEGGQKAIIFADVRETGSGILKELSNLDVEVRIEKLDVADFQLSDRVGVERKNSEDFLQSLIDGRLLRQAKSLIENFERPIFIIEGSELYGLRNVHPNAIRGALSALAIDFKIPIINTRTVKESAMFLAIIAKREQLDLSREIQLRSEKRIMPLNEMQQFIVESLPGIGPLSAKKLLKYFKSVEHVFNASESELKEVENIGEKRAKEIRKVITKKYKKVR